MTIELDHLIVYSRDKRVAAAFLADMLGLPAPQPAGKFLAVRLGHGLSLDFADSRGDVVAQHYAFAVSDAELDAVIARLRERRLPYWADPQRTRPTRSPTAAPAVEPCISPIRAATGSRS
jgi:hypothetical protein